MDLQVIKLKVDIPAPPRETLSQSLSLRPRLRQITHSPSYGRGLRKPISKCAALSQLFKNINRRMHFLLRSPFGDFEQKTYNY